MDDRELLELAAKAAGYAYSPEHGLVFGEDEFGNMTEDDWNPLYDDGDALRLAVELELYLNLGQAGTLVYMPRGMPTVEEYSDDFMCACRRAIVRAAAEIGRSRNG